MDSADVKRRRRRWWWLLVVGIVLGVVAVLVAAAVLPSNERRFERLRDERIVTVAPEDQSYENAVSSDEEIGSNRWLPSTDRASFVSRSYRLPDDADQRSVILQYGRSLHDDDWEDIVIVCDRDGLSVSALKRVRLRLVDTFTMRASIHVEKGVFLQDPGDPWPTFRPGGLGVSVLLEAPPAVGGRTYDVQGDSPSVVRDSRCPVDSIVGDEGNLLAGEQR